MNVLGIIAEYNPFHQGHAYHIKKAKEMTRAEFTVCVISGHFLQRGEPAIVNKWARAKMAILDGADLVLEIPTAYSCRSAFFFALGGISVLNNLGVVTHLAFGSEDADFSLLDQIAELLNKEPLTWKMKLKKHLRNGMSYPQARSLACQECCLELAKRPDFLNKPNNILAISYLRNLKKLNSSIIPVPIKRIGEEFHSNKLTNISSATAIRNLLLQKNKHTSFNENLKIAAEYLPESTVKILFDEFISARGPISLSDLSMPLLLLLRRSKPEDIVNLIDVNEGLENRLIEGAKKFGTIEELINYVKTKRYTHTKITRLLTYLLLNYTKEKESIMDVLSGAKYIRVLAFSKRGTDLLKVIKKSNSIPIVTKVANATKKLSNEGNSMLELDILATDIYSLLYQNKNYRYSSQDFFYSPTPF